MQNFPRIQQKRGDQTPCSTYEYWYRFTDCSSLHRMKKWKLYRKNKKTRKTREAFLEVLGIGCSLLGDHVVKNSRKTIPVKKVSQNLWCGQRSNGKRFGKNRKNKIEEIVNLFSLSKENNAILKDHWDKVQEATAKCKQ